MAGAWTINTVPVSLGRGLMVTAIVVTLLVAGTPRPAHGGGSEPEVTFIESVTEDGDDLLTRFDVPTASVLVGHLGGRGELVLPQGDDVERVFEVASLSKTATALAVLVLAESGSLALDDPVGDHLRSWALPEGAFDLDGVTIRRLLSHTAGLPLGVPPRDEMGVDDSRVRLTEALDGKRGFVVAEVTRQPGEAFEYSNPGYGVLELVIEDVTGTTYPDAMQSLVFGPLAMDNTGFQDDAALLAQVVRGNRSAGNPSRQYQRVPRAAGGMLSTGPDIAKLVRALLSPAGEGGLISADTLAEMHMVPKPAEGAFGLGSNGGYALGLASGTLPSGRTFIANNGSHEGYNALFVAVPDEGSSLVVLTNSETGIGLELELAIRWFDDVIGERPAIATTFVNVRRTVGAVTFGIGVLSLFFFGRQIWQLATGRRSWATRLHLRRLALRTTPLLAMAAALQICLNRGTLTSSLGGLPPARLISSDYQFRVYVVAGLLAAIGIAATAAPAPPRPKGATVVPSRPRPDRARTA